MDYPCHKLPQSKWCDSQGPGGFMGHTCQRSHKRPQITKKCISNTVMELTDQISARLAEKGYGSFASRHEILGIVNEEAGRELLKAVHVGTLEDIRSELLDVCVACIFGVACIDSGTLDW